LGRILRNSGPGKSFTTPTRTPSDAQKARCRCPAPASAPRCDAASPRRLDLGLLVSVSPSTHRGEAPLRACGTAPAGQPPAPVLPSAPGPQRQSPTPHPHSAAGLGGWAPPSSPALAISRTGVGVRDQRPPAAAHRPAWAWRGGALAVAVRLGLAQCCTAAGLQRHQDSGSTERPKQW
jgi:hypothetical protein